MPKVEEFNHIYNKRLSATQRRRLRCASETIILGILDHLSQAPFKGLKLNHRKLNVFLR
jgi:hypothetical protein